MYNDAPTAGGLAQRFNAVRRYSESLVEPLEPDDFNVQPIAEVSPVKWHLAHTSWFFETFILKSAIPGYQVFDESFEYLFNSYYNSVGEQFPREQRATLSRPSLNQVWDFRRHVDEAVSQVLESNLSDELRERLVLGLHHEQQHQELILTDLKYVLGKNPLRPTYISPAEGTDESSVDLNFIANEGGLVTVGTQDENEQFCFDNETPSHKVWLEPFELSQRLVTNEEFLDFVMDDGYQNPLLWLSDGWTEKEQQGWTAPEYWTQRDGQWFEYTLHGESILTSDDPVVHVSFYEADAYARWANCRLPSEHEWEHFCLKNSLHSSQSAKSLASPVMHPRPACNSGEPDQFMGDCWQWTASSYAPYPGYESPPGAIGEYNGKFMANQLVLRGSSCATPEGHARATYRNFFYPKDRWQFSGIRLARDLA